MSTIEVSIVMQWPVENPDQVGKISIGRYVTDEEALDPEQLRLKLLGAVNEMVEAYRRHGPGGPR